VSAPPIPRLNSLICVERAQATCRYEINATHGFVYRIDKLQNVVGAFAHDSIATGRTTRLAEHIRQHMPKLSAKAARRRLICVKPGASIDHRQMSAIICHDAFF